MPVLTTEPATGITPKGTRTREHILDAAARLFAERGYEGTGIRDIEDAAGVNRGVVTYHFGNKESVWKAMFAHTFMPYLEDLRSKADLVLALDSRARTRFLIENFVRMSASRPHMNQLMIQENFTSTWRSRWIIKHLLKPMRELNLRLGVDDALITLIEKDPHVRYALLGACNMPFSLPCEVKALFKQNVSDEAFVQRHVDTVLRIFEGFLAEVEQEMDDV